MKKTISLGMACLILCFGGCSNAAPASQAMAPPIPAPSQPEATQHPKEAVSYPVELAAKIAASITNDGMGEEEKIKAAFDYMIENTYFADPVGLDIWRVRGKGDNRVPIPYLENRALSPLAFGIGSCEDYAAALALLLQQMGLEARYLPGLTYSVDGILVDHAWTMVKSGGEWYHVDCQLEWNISANGVIRYRYFMKSDESMLASHRWGEYMVKAAELSPGQVQEIREDHTPPSCPADAPTPQAKNTTLLEKPNLTEAEAKLREEVAQYEMKNGPLAPLELEIKPPVFHGMPYPNKLQ